MSKDNQVKLVLTAEDNITDVIKKVSDHLGETGLGQSVTAISTGFLAMKAAVEVVGSALGKVFDVIGAGINEASEAEMVNKKLALSMQAVGLYSQDSVNNIDKWSSSLEQSTGTTQDAIKNLMSLGVQQGMNIEMSKKAVQAAMDLSAATGQDLQTSFQTMSMTLSGTSGRLAKLVPELRTLTEEELKNGAGVDLIAKKYNGFSQQTAKTFSGSLIRMNTQLDNVKENFGKMVAQNPAVIGGINALASGLESVAEYAETFSTFIIENSEDLKILGIAFGTAVGIVGTYVAIQNMATIATVATTVAQIALNTAMMASPYGLVVLAVGALTAGLYLLYKNFDLVAGYVKQALGYALKAVTLQLTLFLTGLAKVVGFFNSEWGASLEKVVSKINSVSDGLIANGQAQVANAKASKATADQMNKDQTELQRSIASTEEQLMQKKQALIALEGAYAKAAHAAKTAFEGLADFMPRMNLENFKEDSSEWKNQIDKLKKHAEELKVQLSVGVATEETKTQLEKIQQQLRFASEAEKALKIKTAIETRNAVINEEQIRLDQMKARAISVETEIASMRRQQAQDLRTFAIEQETEKLLAMRGLADMDAQAGITAKQQAMIDANGIELEAFKTKLETEKALAVDMELQKQIAIAEMKASAMSSGTAGGADAQNQVEILQAQAKIAELQRLRSEDMLSEQQYQQELTALKIQEIQNRTATEQQLNQQKMELLGTSPEALQLALDMEKQRTESELMMLREKLSAKMITEEEFRIMKEEAERGTAERQSQIKEEHLTRDAQQNQRLGNQWAATLANMRAEQEKHGQLMGTIRGIQASQEYQGMQGMLSDLSSLRSSSDRKAFEAGKAAAIAQTTINTFMSATSAYASLAGIPIVGPALGIAAAAAAIAAGVQNVANIKKQKFQGGSKAHGGLEEVPRSMDNSTFVLKAGERVVQPNQNKALGEAIDKINGGESGGHTFHFTINGNADDSAIARIKDAVIDAIRESSERGSPIIHEKGIVRG